MWYEPNVLTAPNESRIGHGTSHCTVPDETLKVKVTRCTTYIVSESPRFPNVHRIVQKYIEKQMIKLHVHLIH